jgi:hypothetical protein
MSDLKLTATTRIANQLRALNCKFKIITEDGHEFGELEVAPARAKSDRVNVLAHIDYKTPIAAMQPGDAIELLCPTNLPIESLQCSVSGYSHKLYGAGAVMTSLNREKNALEVLRLE